MINVILNNLTRYFVIFKETGNSGISATLHGSSIFSIISYFLYIRTAVDCKGMFLIVSGL